MRKKAKEKVFKQKVRRFSIWWKLLLPVSVVILVVCSLLSLYAYSTVEEEMIKMGQMQAKTVALLAEANLDGVEIAKVTEPGMESTAAYKAQRDILIKVQGKGNVLYIYTLYTDGTTVYYGVDADTSETACAVGEEFEVGYDELASVFQGEIYVEQEIDSYEGEHLITVYVPIYDNFGNVVAVLGCDYDASSIVSELAETKTKTISITIVGLAISLFVVF